MFVHFSTALFFESLPLLFFFFFGCASLASLGCAALGSLAFFLSCFNLFLSSFGGSPGSSVDDTSETASSIPPPYWPVGSSGHLSRGSPSNLLVILGTLGVCNQILTICKIYKFLDRFWAPENGLE